MWSLCKRTFIYNFWMVKQWRCNFSLISDALCISGLNWGPGQPTWWASLSLLLGDFWQAVSLQWEKNLGEKLLNLIFFFYLIPFKRVHETHFFNKIKQWNDMALKFEATIKREMIPIFCSKNVWISPYLFRDSYSKLSLVIVWALLCFVCDTEQMCL